MKRTCEQCNEEFELTHDHPGRSVICRNCINDPERVTKMNHQFVVGGKVYEKVGLTMQTEPFYEPESSSHKNRKKPAVH
jgi:hypothetical protein